MQWSDKKLCLRCHFPMDQWKDTGAPKHKETYYDCYHSECDDQTLYIGYDNSGNIKSSHLIIIINDIEYHISIYNDTIDIILNNKSIYDQCFKMNIDDDVEQKLTDLVVKVSNMKAFL